MVFIPFVWQRVRREGVYGYRWIPSSPVARTLCLTCPRARVPFTVGTKVIHKPWCGPHPKFFLIDKMMKQLCFFFFWNLGFWIGIITLGITYFNGCWYKWLYNFSEEIKSFKYQSVLRQGAGTILSIIKILPLTEILIIMQKINLNDSIQKRLEGFSMNGYRFKGKIFQHIIILNIDLIMCSQIAFLKIINNINIDQHIKFINISLGNTSFG